MGKSFPTPPGRYSPSRLRTVSNPSKFPFVVLFGPTASGKTSIIEALARGPFKACFELVSADSMQVYRGMDIGTAKPEKSLREFLPHHLIDIRDPREQFTAGDFVREAEAAIREILSRDRIPLVSGGTAYYLKNLLYGMPEAPSSNPAIREEVKRDLAAKGPEALMAELASVDPESAARIHIRDLYRLNRAIEVQRTTGRPLSSFAVPSRNTEELSALVIGIDRPREELYRRIEARVDAMMEAGLVGELVGLEASGLVAGDPGMRAIGYAEFFQAAQGEEGGIAKLAREGARLPLVADAIKMNSRRYAKRQLCFFKSLCETRWFGADETQEIGKAISAFWN